MSAELVKLVLDDADEKMGKAVEHARKEFSGVRTGRAAPALVEKLPVEYYGSEVPLQQIAGFQVPEARMLVISPYDKSSLGRHREGASSTPTSASTRATTAWSSASRSRSSPPSGARSW